MNSQHCVFFWVYIDTLLLIYQLDLEARLATGRGPVAWLQHGPNPLPLWFVWRPTAGSSHRLQLGLHRQEGTLLFLEVGTGLDQGR